MLHRLILAAALAAGLSSAAQAQVADVVQVCGASSGVVTPVGTGGHLTRDVNGSLCIVMTAAGATTANQGAAASDVLANRWPVLAYQGGAWSVGLNAGASVLADLRVAGNAVTTSNPVPISGSVSVSNFPASQPVTNAGTFVVQNTAAVIGGNTAPVKIDGSATTQPVSSMTLAQDSSVQAVKTTLGTPFQAGGSIGNTAFGISGTLPAFAAIPTFKLDQTTPGTTNKVTLGSDLVATNYTQLAGTTLGAPTAYGTAPNGNVQGVNANVTASVLPTGAATQASLASVDGKTPALGTQTKAASRSTTPASDLANIEPAGAPITGASMPAGGTGLTGWLSAIWQGTVGRQNYLAANSTSLPANGFLGDGNYVFLGPSPSPYTYLNASFFSAQAGTYTVQVTDGTNGYTIASGTLASGTLATVRLPAVAVATTGTRYRAYIQNGANVSSLAFSSISLVAN